MRLMLWKKQARQIHDNMFIWMELMRELYETHPHARKPDLRDRLHKQIDTIERHKEKDLENVAAWVFCEATSYE